MNKSWKLKEWHDFSEKVKKRDGYKCLQCERNKSQVTLQVHHEMYVQDKLPWEYPLSDCRTLCKGCHAKKHGLLEPDKGWYLIEINDLGGLDGICEKNNCGREIRYEHLTYHPNWGYKIVGSTCIEHLTQKDKLLSNDIIKLYKKISEFIHNSVWVVGLTKNSKKYIGTKYKHHLIRIYGENNYSFQIAVKETGIHKLNYHKPILIKDKILEEIKELACIVLKGTISEDEEEKNMLRAIYRSIK